MQKTLGLFRQSSVKTKLVTLILAACVPSVLISLLCLGFLNIQYARNNLSTNIQIITDLTVDHLSAPVAFNDVQRSSEVLLGLRRNSSIRHACLYDKSGQKIASYHLLPENQGLCVDTHNSADTLIAFQSSVTQRNEVIGKLVIFASFEQIHKLVFYQTLVLLFCLFLVLLLVSLPLASVLQREISHPIYEILETSKKLYTNDIQTIGNTKASDELLLSLLLLRQAEGAIKLQNQNLEKIDSIIANKEILFSSLDEATSSNKKVRELLSGLYDNNPYQNLDELYTYTTKLSTDLDQELSDTLELFKQLHEEEKNTLSKTRDKVYLNQEITTFLSAHTEVNSPNNIEYIYQNSDGATQISIYKETLNTYMKSLMDLCNAIILEENSYELSLFFSEESSALVCEIKSKNKQPSIDDFDLNSSEIDDALIRAKYYSNLNNPRPGSFQISLLEDRVRILSRLAKD